jgi:hypothetical protein
MGVQVDWAVENRVIITRVWGNFTMAELIWGASEAQIMVKNGQAPVHDIIDMRHMHRFPLFIPQITKATPLFREAHLGYVIVLTYSGMVRFISQAVLQSHQARLALLQEQAEAVAFLRQVDTSLPDFHLPDFQAH